MKDRDDDKPSNINDKTAEAPPEESAPDDGQYIFVACIRHHITGKIIRRANGRPFRIKVKPGRTRRPSEEVPPK